MRLVRGLSAVVLLGCASSQGGSSPQGVVETVSVPRDNVSMDIRTVRSSTTGVATIASPVEQVWQALQGAYGSLGIPLSTLEADKHTIGNRGLKVRRQLGNVSLVKYLDCGSSQGGPSADSYEIFLSVLSSVKSAAPGETILSTTLEATGRPVSFSSGEVRCTTTGALEGRIAEAVRARVKG